MDPKQTKRWADNQPSTRHETRMIIHTAKIPHRDGKLRRILGFENVALPGDVPQRYMDGYPEVRADEERNGIALSITIYDTEHGAEATLSKGDEVPEEEYQERLDSIKRAGARLARIRRDIEKSQQGWANPHVIDVI